MLPIKKFNGIALCIQIFILILTIISTILILTAPGACFTAHVDGLPINEEVAQDCRDHEHLSMSSEKWERALQFQGRGGNIKGQFVIICLTIALSAITAGMSCVTFVKNSEPNWTRALISGLFLIAFVLCGLVEHWYTNGFGHMPSIIHGIDNGKWSGCAGIPGCEVMFVVKGWAAATAFYFIGAILYFVDLALNIYVSCSPMFISKTKCEQVIYSTLVEKQTE